MNLIFCTFGGMPTCHGAGGLAGQYKFGARHGSSVIVLGLIKMILAIMGGNLIPVFLGYIPNAILGVLLAVAGHELANTGLNALYKRATVLVPLHGSSATNGNVTADGTTASTFKRMAAVTLLTAVVVVGTHKTHYGALCGMISHYFYTIKWARLFQQRLLSNDSSNSNQ